MKKKWEEPRILVQQFAPNEYVSACWKIKCNVPYGYGFIDNNGNGTYDRWSDTYLAGGQGCGEYHSGVPGDNGPVANAMWQPTDRWGRDQGSAYPVYMFNTGNHNPHFSKVEDAEWETNPNAS